MGRVENYTDLFTDNFSGKSVGNTFQIHNNGDDPAHDTGLLLALLLNQKLKGRTIARVFVIIPYVISSAAAGVVWKWM